MANPDPLALEKDPDHVEPVRLPRAAVSSDPDRRGPGQLALLPPPDGLDRVTEPVSRPRLHLDEGDCPAPFGHDVDVTVAASVPSLQDSPTLTGQPAFGDALTCLPQCLRGR